MQDLVTDLSRKDIYFNEEDNEYIAKDCRASTTVRLKELSNKIYPVKILRPCDTNGNLVLHRYISGYLLNKYQYNSRTGKITKKEGRENYELTSYQREKFLKDSYLSLT